MTAAQHFAIALLACGCATGGKDGGDGPIDAPKPIDSNQVTIDAPRMIDAPASIDAPIMIDAMIDAPSGPFCNGNSECTVSGECCFALGGPGVCVPGTIPIPGTCLPN